MNVVAHRILEGYYLCWTRYAWDMIQIPCLIKQKCNITHIEFKVNCRISESSCPTAVYQMYSETEIIKSFTFDVFIDVMFPQQ